MIHALQSLPREDEASRSEDLGLCDLGLVSFPVQWKWTHMICCQPIPVNISLGYRSANPLSQPVQSDTRGRASIELSSTVAFMERE